MLDDRVRAVLVADGLQLADGEVERLVPRGLAQRAVGAAADHVEALLEELGVPRRVSAYGIPREKMDGVATASLADLVVRESPRKVDEAVIYELLEEVW